MPAHESRHIKVASCDATLIRARRLQIGAQRFTRAFGGLRRAVLLQLVIVKNARGPAMPVVNLPEAEREA